MTKTAPFRTAMLLAATILAGTLPALAPANAREATATAVIEWDYRPRPRLVVDGTMWRCGEESCTGTIVDTPAAAHRACYRLAVRYGRVARFETPSGALSEEELARCNRSRD